MTESQLVRQAADGDAWAIKALYDRYAPRVFAVVRRIAGDDETAQDFAQEAWIRAVRALPSFRGDARFSTWLHRVAVNSALQGRRKSETRRRKEAPFPTEVPVGPRGGDTLLQRRLERALDALPEGMRQVLILHDVEGYTHEEIGDALGVAPGTSKSQLFKARAKLIRRISARSSTSICGRPPGERDFQRQYRRKPARCQRTTVSGRMIAIAFKTEGNHRYSWTKKRRSLFVSWTRPRTFRRSTIS